jgi:hypothetical protein
MFTTSAARNLFFLPAHSVGMAARSRSNSPTPRELLSE